LLARISHHVAEVARNLWKTGFVEGLGGVVGDRE